MAKRARRKAKSRKTARKAVKRETALRKKSKKAGSNKRAHWSAFRTLQKRVDKAWGKLRSDVKKKASAAISNLAQRRHERWPPGMAGHKKPAHRPACLRLGQAQTARLTVTGVLIEQLEHRNVAALLQASDQEMPTLTLNMGQPFRRQVTGACAFTGTHHLQHLGLLGLVQINQGQGIGALQSCHRQTFAEGIERPYRRAGCRYHRAACRSWHRTH